MSGIIILAEDDPMIQRLLSRMIKRSGYSGNVQTCNDANSALKFASENSNSIDLILLDTGLHEKGDAIFFEEMRLIITSAPIFISSGYSEDIIRSDTHFGSSEISGVLSKPFGMNEVKELLTELHLTS